MSKAYTQEKRGIVQGSLVSPEVYPSAHTPEEEKQFQKLVKELQPIMMQSIQQSINVFLEEQYDIHEGDTLQTIINYITNYFKTYITGMIYGPGKGIDGSALGAGVVQVWLGDTPQGLTFAGTSGRELRVYYSDGLELDGSVLEAQCNTAAAVGKDSSGIKVLLSNNVETGSGGGSGGLSFDDTEGSEGKLRVDPEDFLKLA